MNRSAVEKEIEQCLGPVIEAEGLELVEVALLGSGGRRLLRITIDKEGGVTHADCINVSRQVDPLLDVKEWMHGSYNLEVSSPGTNRPLKKERDFLRFRGRLVSVRTTEPLQEGDKRKHFRGRLTAFAGATVQLEMEGGGRVDIPLREGVKVNLEPEWTKAPGSLNRKAGQEET